MKPYTRGNFQAIKTDDKKQPYKVQVYGELNKTPLGSINTWITIGHHSKLEKARKSVRNFHAADRTDKELTEYLPR